MAMLAVSWASIDAQGNPSAQKAQPAFDRIFGAFSPKPTLKVSSSYSYPSFEVTFRSKEELAQAARQIAEFKGELNVLFRGYGSREGGFDAELATFFTYPGHLQELSDQKRER